MDGKLFSIISSSKATIPSLDTILAEAWRKLRLNKKGVSRSFGNALVKMDEEGTKIFKKYEKKALVELAKAWLNSQKNEIREKFRKIVMQSGWEGFIEEASQLFVEFGTLVQAIEKDLGNMRKARGGKGFEKIILKLLSLLNLMVKCQPAKLKRN